MKKDVWWKDEDGKVRIGGVSEIKQDTPLWVKTAKEAWVKRHFMRWRKDYNSIVVYSNGQTSHTTNGGQTFYKEWSIINPVNKGF